MKHLRYLAGWVLVRPRRWLFSKMVFNCYLQLKPTRPWPEAPSREWSWPNPHWWLLYRTVFRFFKWLNYDAWRPLCVWEKGGLRHKPWIARVIHRIGATTAGCAISGGECWHCASIEGCPVDLASGESDFLLTDSGSYGTQDGTTHWFEGVTTCPKCGFKQEYRDSD